MNQHETKRCCTCRKRKPIQDFYRLRSATDGRYPNCSACYKQSRKPKADRIRRTRRAWEKRVREEALQRYGGSCSCCGETQYEFLSLDLAGTGSVPERKVPLPYALKRAGYPKGWRVLCHNCSTALSRYGYCPHGQMV